MKRLSSTDRKALIRLASALPKGSEERKVILAGLGNAKTAGYWGYGPLESDHALDLLHTVGRMDPVKGRAYIKKMLKSRDFENRWSAMGVWAAVMNSDVNVYKKLFDDLDLDVMVAARKGYDADEEGWEAKGLDLFAKGKWPRNLRRKFQPVAYQPPWYTLDAQADSDGQRVSLDVVMRNQYTKENQTVSTELGLPVDMGDDVEASVEVYGSKGAKEQPVLVTVVDSNGEGYQTQLAYDSMEGFSFRGGEKWERM